MRHSILLIILMFFVFACTEQKQKIMLYKDVESGILYNENEYGLHKIEYIDVFRNQVSNKITLNEIFTDSIKTKDSVIIYFKLGVTLEQDAEKIYSYKNQNFPSINLKTIDNRIINIYDLKGKPTFINFWFTTCKPCIEEMPTLNRLKEKYINKVNFVSITSESYEVTTKFFDLHEFNFLTIIEAINLIEDLGIRSFPKNILLDENGVIRLIEGKILSDDDIKSNSNKYINEIEKEINKLL